MEAAVFRTIFAQPTSDAVAATWDQVRDQLRPLPQARTPHGPGQGRGPGLHRLPPSAQDQDLVHQPLERLNKEIKRRARLVGIFPNEAAVMRLIGMVLADTKDEWITDERRYLSEGSMAKLLPEPDSEPITGSES